TFIKKSSLIAYSREALEADSKHIQRLAKLEGLTAHAKSVAIRTKKKIGGGTGHPIAGVPEHCRQGNIPDIFLPSPCFRSILTT
ncbi:MAG: histidinol dehydrogenase, partial [Desulfurivibrio sp.]|nr:histidinol dehydrogenase [Desulfurivibrio sp.]